MIQNAQNKIYIGSDHAGIDLKEELIQRYPHLPWEDCGTRTADSVDFPDFADQVCQKLNATTDSTSRGVLICGSGQGMAMRANKYPQIRAALCWNVEIAKLAREHNNANVLCLGARFLPVEDAMTILETFLETPFGGGRHMERVQKINAPVRS